jgi:hypothetical protein
VVRLQVGRANCGSCGKEEPYSACNSPVNFAVLDTMVSICFSRLAQAKEVTGQRSEDRFKQTPNTQYRTPNVERRIQQAAFLTRKVTIKNPVVFGDGIGNSPGMI